MENEPSRMADAAMSRMSPVPMVTVFWKTELRDCVRSVSRMV